MIAKPQSCIGCPAYSWGPYYVPDEEDHGQKVIILAQNPGESEERGRRFLGWSSAGGEKWDSCPPGPLTGKSGHEVDRVFLPLAGLERGDVRCGNVIRCRWKNGNTLPPLTGGLVREAIQHCQRVHFTEPRPDQTVVVLGAYALWAMTGEFGAEGADDEDDSRASRSIDGWRGWIVKYKPQWDITMPPKEVHGPTTTLQDWRPSITAGFDTGGVTVFVTYHPAFFYRAHWLKPVGKADWAKLGKLLKGTWPEPVPEISRETPAQWPKTLAFDTEYVPSTGELIRYSVAWRDADGTPRVHVVEARDIQHTGTSLPRVVIQHNAEADWPYLTSVFGADTMDWEDTMYAHSALYGTLRHTLDFLGSLYSRTNRWKHLEQGDEITYSGLDALGTWDTWQSLAVELARDSQSQRVYEEEMKPLLPHLLVRPPIHLNTRKVVEGIKTFEAAQKDCLARGAVAAGWPLNVGSPQQVAKWIGVKA